MSKAVEFKNVYFTYSRSTAAEGFFTLKNISFEISSGEYVALIGHNGSGKSTIAKLISGVLDYQDPNERVEEKKPQKKKNKKEPLGEENQSEQESIHYDFDPETSGIYICEEKVDVENYMRLQKKVGMVFQNPDNQFVGATVKDDIAFGLENDCVPQKEMLPLIEKYAEKVGMIEFLDREPTALSGGQKQRVAIAGTLVRHPSILVLDEATSMLDPKGRREIRSLIKLMKEENPDLTIISITHDIEEAYQADRVIVLNHGEIALQGAPSEVFKNHEILNEINLTIPFYLDLKNKLIDKGIDIENVNDLEGLVKKLCQ